MGLMIVKLKVNDSFLVLYFTKASYRILQIFIISWALRWLWVVIYYLYILLSVENAAKVEISMVLDYLLDVIASTLIVIY